MGAERTLCVLLKSTSCICLSFSLSFFLLLHSQKDLKVMDPRLSPFNEASSLCHSVHLTIIKPPFPGSSWPVPGHIPECPRDGLLKMQVEPRCCTALTVNFSRESDCTEWVPSLWNIAHPCYPPNFPLNLPVFQQFFLGLGCIIPPKGCPHLQGNAEERLSL